MTDVSSAQKDKPRSAIALAILGLGLLALTVALIALGTWQVYRLSWKLDLIARVDGRVHAEPVAPPAQADWSKVNAQSDEYRRVTASGTFENDKETLVTASTALGPGYWVLTPLRLADGSAILVNRGFVPIDRRSPASRQVGQIDGPVDVTGLLRMSEPNGMLLRSNDPAGDLWYSRDIGAIIQKRGIADAAPFFIDADATPNAGGFPVGGLTVLDFPNNHLVYAFTWYVLAITVAGLLVYIVRSEIRIRRRT
ncbi:surfeit locus 1 family protein [Rhizobium sp. BK529]|uniref:SURF1 family protein n=1 Tax=unclassified Rhizobium TaxID=2613769 RepID=UPI001047AD69|nr:MULTISPECIES: SURF1 family protein [unclassified Rhizobium]MBB3593213.1 surfeit locus 1 family protein [Rhizobium sp. BK529]TCS03012.1 surfeit locus 1 family protein [Rhizobium sp. BK418]